MRWVLMLFVGLAAVRGRWHGGLTNARCAPIMEHHENSNCSRPKEPIHQPIELDWSGRRNCDHAEGKSHRSAHS
jgi:hypothetical protein